MTIEFNSRESYLTYRLDWKARYRDLSDEIRDTRQAIKEAYRDGQESRAAALQAHKARLRAQASAMMVELAEAKIEANRQYLAEKELSHV